ncbi:hypothetical protein [Streptomyces noursei]|uniref:hypothetical protein n=1 Tax=Streptomyces noursei TaxID=1971 RepID=UPI0011AF3E85
MVDDTLFKRRRKKAFGAAWQHDGAARVPKDGRGTCFVVVGIVVELPFLTRPVRLPVMARPWRPNTGPSKVEPAASMDRLLAVCLDRRLHVVADAHHDRTLHHLPEATTVPPTAGQHHAVRPRAAADRQTWPPRLKGARLGTPTDLAATATFTIMRASSTAAPTERGSPRLGACGTAPSTPDRPRDPDPRRRHVHRL